MENNKITQLNTDRAVNKYNEGAPQQHPRKELSPELKEYITETSKNIIFDSIPKDMLEHYLYNVTLNTNEQTGDYDVAIINLFPIPASMTDIMCVNTIILDLNTRKVSAPPIMFGPIVIRKDKSGIERDAVIIGRYGDVSITNSTPANTIAPEYEIEMYYRHQEQDAERLAAANKADEEVVNVVPEETNPVEE